MACLVIFGRVAGLLVQVLVKRAIWRGLWSIALANLKGSEHHESRPEKCRGDPGGRPVAGRRCAQRATTRVAPRAGNVGLRCVLAPSGSETAVEALIPCRHVDKLSRWRKAGTIFRGESFTQCHKTFRPHHVDIRKGAAGERS